MFLLGHVNQTRRGRFLDGRSHSGLPRSGSWTCCSLSGGVGLVRLTASRSAERMASRSVWYGRIPSYRYRATSGRTRRLWTGDE